MHFIFQLFSTVYCDFVARFGSDLAPNNPPKTVWNRFSKLWDRAGLAFFDDFGLTLDTLSEKNPEPWSGGTRASAARNGKNGKSMPNLHIRFFHYLQLFIMICLRVCDATLRRATLQNRIEPIFKAHWNRDRRKGDPNHKYCRDNIARRPMEEIRRPTSGIRGAKCPELFALWRMSKFKKK